jgi:hippurate hydrolase
MMASSTRVEIEVEGTGGHAAKPHLTVDPVLIATEIVNALQLVVSRNVDPLAGTVLSITQIHTGTAFNIIPDRVYIGGTLRTLNTATRDFAQKRIHEVATGIAAAHRAKAKVTLTTGYPVTENHRDQTEFAERVAKDVAGAARVDGAMEPSMGSEDFSFMLLERPGAFIFIGNGDTASVHNAKYDFDDAALPIGMSYWARLVEMAMPAN